jgi:hypothetical protein
MESFKLKMPTCPQCGSTDTRIDIRDCANLVRIPAAVGSAALIGIPLTAIAFVCRQCNTQFKDKADQ